MLIPAEKAELLVSFIRADKPSVQCGRLRTGRQDTVIPAGQVIWVKCQVPPNMNSSDTIFLSEPDENNAQLTELDVGEGLLEAQNLKKSLCCGTCGEQLKASNHSTKENGTWQHPGC